MIPPGASTPPPAAPAATDTRYVEAPGTAPSVRIAGFGYAIVFRLAGVSSVATSLHFFVNLRTPDHFEALAVLVDRAHAPEVRAVGQHLAVDEAQVLRRYVDERRVEARVARDLHLVLLRALSAVFHVSAGMVETVAFSLGAVAFGRRRLGLGRGGREEEAGREREREQACREASHALLIAPERGGP